MTAETKTLNRQGRRQSTLAHAAMQMRVIKLERPAAEHITTASMPNAPLGYQWPHLKAHARSAYEAPASRKDTQ